ncbi:LysR family transcriptional regulator [Acidaminococcus intestini]|nr:LysR family transcriptional regulator [Acidaminococcus intestini]
MQTSYEMFLLAAKTLNFTKAASLAHITQQSFSEHIKKLEKKLEPCFLRGLPALHSPNRAAFFTKPYGKWILSNAAAWCT